MVKKLLSSGSKSKNNKLLSGKAGVALLYLFVGEEAKRNNGLLDDDSTDLNRIDFESKGST